jgi:hypothetical protein
MKLLYFYKESLYLFYYFLLNKIQYTLLQVKIKSKLPVYFNLCEWGWLFLFFAYSNLHKMLSTRENSNYNYEMNKDLK